MSFLHKVLMYIVHLASTASTTYGEHSGYTYLPSLEKINSIKIDSSKVDMENM